MIKAEYKIIILSIILGLFAGIIDSLVGYFIFSKGPFWDLLIFEVPLQELYVRSVLLIIFILFGLAISKLLFKRKQVEVRAKLSEEKYRSLVESTEDSIYVVDRNYKYLFMNDKHLSRTGLSADQYLGRTYSEFHPPEKTKEFTEKVDKVFKTGNSIHDEHMSHRDSRYFLRILSPIKPDDGSTVAVTIVSREITALKKMSDERERLILELKNALDKVKTLSGFLPICASCKKIRDDKGYWSQVEQYISEHSEVEFSHGLCPECAEKMVQEIESIKNNL
jgi:PAS domain S-box-containing protein